MNDLPSHFILNEIEYNIKELSVLRNFTKTDLCLEPYPHIVIKNCLNQEIYDHLEKTYPSDDLIYKMDKNTDNDSIMYHNTRYQINSDRIYKNFENNNLNNIDNIWFLFIKYHTSELFLNEVKNAFNNNIFINCDIIQNKIKQKVDQNENETIKIEKIIKIAQRKIIIIENKLNNQKIKLQNLKNKNIRLNNKKIKLQTLKDKIIKLNELNLNLDLDKSIEQKKLNILNNINVINNEILELNKLNITDNISLIKNEISELNDSYESQNNKINRLNKNNKIINYDSLKIGVRNIDQLDILLDCQVGINSPCKIKSTVKTPHIDNLNEIYAGLFYMKQPTDKGKGGDLIIYEPKKNYSNFDEFKKNNPLIKINKITKNRNVIESRGFNKNKLKLVKKIKYEKNVLVLFLSTINSIHAVSPRNVNTISRRLVNIIGESYCKENLQRY
jgi:hypothetical protein